MYLHSPILTNHDDVQSLPKPSVYVWLPDTIGDLQGACKHVFLETYIPVHTQLMWYIMTAYILVTYVSYTYLDILDCDVF